MNKFLFLIALSIFSTACEPARVMARVKPDRSAKMPLGKNRKMVPVDIYLSQDGLVELQIFDTTGSTKNAAVHGVLQNNHKIPIEVDLAATRTTTTTNGKLEDDVLPLDAWGENGNDKKLVLAPGESRRVRWTLNPFTTELRLPIKISKASTLIVSKFKKCEVKFVVGKVGCDTVH